MKPNLPLSSKLYFISGNIISMFMSKLKFKIEKVEI